MALIMISVDREALPVHTQDDFEEYVKYWIGEIAFICMDNPLHDQIWAPTVREISK